MKTFLKELKRQASRYLDLDEANELVNYYEEIINERLLDGENIEEIVSEYNIEEIIKEALPNIILKRNDKVFKTSFQVLLLLFSTPILLPLAIAYLAVLIALGAVVVSFIAVSFGGLVLIIPYLIEVIKFTSNFGQIVGLAALGILVATSMFYLGITMVRVMYSVLKKVIKAFLNIFMKKRSQHETY